MLRRYIIIAEESKAENRDQFTGFIRGLEEAYGVKWWHRMQMTWLIVDPRKKASAMWWRQAALRFMPESEIFVVRTTGRHWSTHVRSGGGEWLKDTWASDSASVTFGDPSPAQELPAPDKEKSHE